MNKATVLRHLEEHLAPLTWRSSPEQFETIDTWATIRGRSIRIVVQDWMTSAHQYRYVVSVFDELGNELSRHNGAPSIEEALQEINWGPLKASLEA